jgi:flagellar protein FlgJ
MSALGAFAGGLGNSLQDGKDRDERQRLYGQQDRALDIEESRVSAGAYDQPQYQPMDRDAYTGRSGLGTRPNPNAADSGHGGSTRGSSRLWDLVDNHEGGGGYDTLFGFSNNGGQFADTRVSQMTLGDLRDFSNPSGEYGQWVRGELDRNGQRARVATPMGRFQIVGTTMRNTADALGLADDVVFNEQTQLQMADHLARQRLRSSDTMTGKMAGLRAEWEGFHNVSDADLRRAIEEFERR